MRWVAVLEGFPDRPDATLPVSRRTGVSYLGPEEAVKALKVAVDPNMPEGVVEFRDPETGKTLLRVENLGSSLDPERLSQEVCLALTIAIPKALAKDGFVRFKELSDVVQPILARRLKA